MRHDKVEIGVLCRSETERRRRCIWSIVYKVWPLNRNVWESCSIIRYTFSTGNIPPHTSNGTCRNILLIHIIQPEVEKLNYDVNLSKSKQKCRTVNRISNTFKLPPLAVWPGPCMILNLKVWFLCRYKIIDKISITIIIK